MKLAWPERTALAWWLLLFVVMEAAWRGDHPMLAEPSIWRIFFVIVGVPWLALRCIDFAFGGPIRRRVIGSAPR